MSILPFPQPFERPGSPDPSADDAVVMARVAAGDVSALDRLIERDGGPLTAYAARIVGDRDAGKDVVQAVLIRLWERRADWRPGPVRAYLLRLTRNRAIDYRRQREMRGRLASLVRLEWTRIPRTPADELESGALREAVDAAIQELPPRRREVFVLAYLRGLSYREVASVLGISVSTVSNQMVAALEELRSRLGPLAGRRPTASRPIDQLP